jgi:hypothetical protein
MNLNQSRGSTALGVIFSLIGIGCAVGGAWWAVSTRDFMATAERGVGQVVELDASTDSDGDTTYYPIVEYAVGGKTQRFKSNVGSSPPSHRVGDTVNVLYDPENPTDAKIDSFLDVWGGPLFLTLFGVIFAAVGIAVAASSVRKSRVLRRLKQNGTRVQAEIVTTETAAAPTESGTRVRIAGISLGQGGTAAMWRIKAKWTDSQGTERFYFGPWLKHDPSGALSGRTTVDLIVDPANPETYLMEMPPGI